MTQASAVEDFNERTGIGREAIVLVAQRFISIKTAPADYGSPLRA
jgi:hypothetical protein